jgi:hypothetical protein
MAKDKAKADLVISYTYNRDSKNYWVYGPEGGGSLNTLYISKEKYPDHPGQHMSATLTFEE